MLAVYFSPDNEATNMKSGTHFQRRCLKVAYWQCLGHMEFVLLMFYGAVIGRVAITNLQCALGLKIEPALCARPWWGNPTNSVALGFAPELVRTGVTPAKQLALGLAGVDLITRNFTIRQLNSFFKILQPRRPFEYIKITTTLHPVPEVLMYPFSTYHNSVATRQFLFAIFLTY